MQSRQAPRSASSAGKAFLQAEQQYLGRSTIRGPSYSILCSSTSSVPLVKPYRSRIFFGIVIFPFLSTLTLIKIPSKIKKVRQPKSDAPKNANPDCCNTKLNKYPRKPYPPPSGICIFTKFIIGEKYRNKALYKNREFSANIFIKFCVAKTLYHIFFHFAIILFFYPIKSKRCVSRSQTRRGFTEISPKNTLSKII